MLWLFLFYKFVFWNYLKSFEILNNLAVFHYQSTFPANICWSSRRLEDVFKTSRKTSWRRLGRRKIVTLKTSSRRLEDMSWRPLEDIMETKQNPYWGCLYLNMYLTNLYFKNLYLTILRRIQNTSIRTHHFNICLVLEHKQHLYFKN